jgi:hypothetical protein
VADANLVLAAGDRPGLIAGGALLFAGVLALLLVLLAAVWAGREKARPAGLGGLFLGLAAGIAGLLEIANARCAASNVSGPGYLSRCVAPDLTPWFVVAAMLAAVGVTVSLATVARGRVPKV